MELESFGVRIVEIKSGVVKSNIAIGHQKQTKVKPSLPKGSIYKPPREVVEKVMTGGQTFKDAIEADVWAITVVGGVVENSPPRILMGLRTCYCITTSSSFITALQKTIHIQNQPPSSREP